MSDDEFSDFSDDQPTVLVAPAPVENKIEELLHLTLESQPPVVNADITVKEETLYESPPENVEPIKGEDDMDIPNFPLDWTEYKKIESDVLKHILLFSWVEEKFVVRASLKNIIFKENYEFKTKVYDI